MGKRNTNGESYSRPIFPIPEKGNIFACQHRFSRKHLLLFPESGRGCLHFACVDPEIDLRFGKMNIEKRELSPLPSQCVLTLFPFLLLGLNSKDETFCISELRINNRL